MQAVYSSVRKYCNNKPLDTLDKSLNNSTDSQAKDLFNKILGSLHLIPTYTNHKYIL